MKQPIPFGKYYLLERVNVGGMAEVFKAKATGVEGFERLVAVKRILPAIAEDEEFITMFVDEAKIAVQLTHASIAQIFDLGKVDDSYFIALEYIHGKDMRAIFNRSRTKGELLPISMACYVIMKACEGLDYAHNKRDASGGFINLVHRDVSPQNILVSYEGEVKIIDFGIAKAAGKVGRTQAGILKGKFGYMSPEQVQGFEIDRRSDVFGVGICLYELLTGERLFVGESDFSTLEKVRNVDIMPPSTYNRRIPEELEQIVLKALARDVDERHLTAMALHDDLQAFMYTSGNFFGRKDLSMYMHRVFAEELEKENARNREYVAQNVIPEEAVTGLSAFDEIDPVSEIAEFDPDPDPMALPEPRFRPPAPAPAPTPAPLPKKATLLGMPPVGQNFVPPAQPAPRVPPLRPSAMSIPPSLGGPPPARLQPQAQPQPQPRPPGQNLDWDDEELSTQIYDRPDDLSDLIPTSTPALASGLQSSPNLQPVAPVAVPPAQTRPDPTAVMPPGSAYPAPQSRRNNALMWTGMVLIGAIGVALLAMLILKDPPGGTIHLRTIPSDAQVKLDGQPVSGSTSPFVITEVVPGVTHEIEVAQSGYRSWSSKVELQPDQTLELPQVTLESMQSGFALDSTPTGATVFIDGKKLDSPTPVRVSTLMPGKHQIRIEASGFAPWETPLNVTAGTVLEMQSAELVPAEAQPEKKPTRRERQRARGTRGRSPRPSKALPRPSPRPRPAPVASGTGTLRLNTRPWSKVFVDGRMIGNTPQMNLSVPAGPHTLTFVNDDFGIRKTIRVNVGKGKTVTKVLTLTQ